MAWWQDERRQALAFYRRHQQEEQRTWPTNVRKPGPISRKRRPTPS